MFRSRFARFATLTVILVLVVTGVARAQTPELASIFEIDPALALNGFAVFAGAIVLLFEVYRSRP
jgi:hypothetical protein